MSSGCFVLARVSPLCVPLPGEREYSCTYCTLHTVGTEWVTKTQPQAQCHVVHSQPKILSVHL